LPNANDSARASTLNTDALTEHVTSHAVELRRRILSRYFHGMFGGRIQQGPLKGFPVEIEARWGPGDAASKLFGLYEQEVLAIAEQASSHRSVLVNLGAADGYYGVGLVATGVYPRSVCYELDDEGRDFLARSAETHGVAERVRILGGATRDFPVELRKLDIPIRDVLVLCDVEGAEFEIFDADCLGSLRGAESVIELHEFMVADGPLKMQSLVECAQRHFHVHLFKTGYRDLSGIRELDLLSDSDRWLVCSEGRTKMMSWLHLTPR
jgi:hypothetical protein